MIITSPSFDDGAFIPKKFSYDGGGINPELQIQNVPTEAVSLVLVVHDPDAPVPGGFYHWRAESTASTCSRRESRNARCRRR